MKKRFAALGVAAAFAFAPLFSFTANAYSGTTWIPQLSSLRAWLGDYITGGYIGTDGNYHSCSFVPYTGSTEKLNNINNIVYGLSDEWNNRDFVWYQLQDNLSPIGMNDANFQPIIYIDLNLKFTNCDYAEMFCVSARSSSFFGYTNSSSDFGTLKTLNYGLIGTDTSSNYNYHYMLENSLGTNPNSCKSTFNTNLSLFGGVFESDSPATVYFGTFQCTNVRQLVNLYLIGICCPTLDSNAQFAGREAPPGSAPDPVIPSATTPASGNLSGTISENSSGGFDIDYSIQIDVPDYNSKLDALSSGLNPSYDSSAVDQVGSAASDYNAVESALMDDSTFNLDSLDSYDLNLDDSALDGHLDPMAGIFSYPLIASMIGIVSALAIISFTLFGKWV